MLLLTSWQRSWGNNSRTFLEKLCTFPHKMKHKCDIEGPTLGQNKLFSLLKKFKYRKSSKEFQKIYFSPMLTKPPSVSFSHGNFTDSKETKNDCSLPTKVKSRNIECLFLRWYIKLSFLNCFQKLRYKGEDETATIGAQLVLPAIDLSVSPILTQYHKWMMVDLNTGEMTKNKH